MKYLSIWAVVCAVASCVPLALSVKESNDDWQGCDVFVAPSATGWGVYASRSFEQDDMVTVSSFFVPISLDKDNRAQNLVTHSVLDDYTKRYTRRPEEIPASVVLFGFGMFFNHHPEPNVRYATFGQGEYHALGFRAIRKIEAGEQLFTSYSNEEGGLPWFQDRHLEMIVSEESQISSDDLPHFRSLCCSKIYAGPGRPMWKKIAKGEDMGVDESRLAPIDAGLGNARAKVPISKGETLEVGPGLILSLERIQGTALAGLAFTWEDLSEENQSAVRILQQTGQITLQYQGEDTDWEPLDDFIGFDDLVILPVSGTMGAVRRVGDHRSSNCRLAIHWRGVAQGTVTATLELIATKDIAVGGILRLNIPASTSLKDLALLRKELIWTEQSFAAEMFPEIKGGWSEL